MATAEQALRLTNDLHKRLTARRKGIARRFSYFDGHQPLVYATEEWRKFHADRYKGFSDNWCGVVANSPVDRLRIDGLRLGGSTDVATSDERELWDDWQRNELTAQSNQGFLASIVAKRSATLVWAGEDEAPEVSWERPDQMIVDYSATGRGRTAALKAWVDRDAEREYATLYLSDGVWKWERGISAVSLRASGFVLPEGVIGANGGWTPRQVRDEDWPLPNPLGVVPVVEWLNRPRLGGQPISDIDGTIAMQDAINALWGYLFSAADYVSMPARVVTGSEPPKVPILDEAGQVIGSRPAKMEDVAERRIMFLPGQGIGVEQWDAAKLDGFQSVIADAIGHIAAQTRTPGHYLLSNEKFANLNGDALTAAEVPLATKVENEQTHFNPSAKETAALMALVRGKKDMAAAIRASDGRQFVQWKHAAMHSLAQIADAATKDRAVGMSLRTVLERRYGFTEPEIDREMDRIRAEQVDPFLQNFGVNRGNDDEPAAVGQ